MHIYTCVYGRNTGNRDPQETLGTHSTTTYHLHHLYIINFGRISTERADILLKHEANFHLVESQPKWAQGGPSSPTTWPPSLCHHRL